MSSQTFVITGSKWVNLNGSHGNAHAHQSNMDQWKQLAATAVTNEHPYLMGGQIRITATVHRTTNGRSDAHNVTPTIKACIDALVPRVIVDDSDDVVAELTIKRGENKPKPTITLTVTDTQDEWADGYATAERYYQRTIRDLRAELERLTP